jgi:hypothetical protein
MVKTFLFHLELLLETQDGSLGAAVVDALLAALEETAEVRRALMETL